MRQNFLMENWIKRENFSGKKYSIVKKNRGSEKKIIFKKGKYSLEKFQ